MLPAAAADPASCFFGGCWAEADPGRHSKPATKASSVFLNQIIVAIRGPRCLTARHGHPTRTPIAAILGAQKAQSAASCEQEAQSAASCEQEPQSAASWERETQTSGRKPPVRNTSCAGALWHRPGELRTGRVFIARSCHDATLPKIPLDHRSALGTRIAIKSQGDCR